MNNSLDNDLSAWMDDELPPSQRDELYQALKADPVLIEKWTHYHLARDALGNRLPAHISLNLADRVRVAIEAEPTHFLPQKRSPSPTPKEEAPARPAVRPAWFMPAAAAATVAAVAILGFQLDRGDGAGRGMAVAPTPSLPAASLVAEQGRERTPPQWLRGEPPRADDLSRHLAGAGQAAPGPERYLVEHNGVAVGAGVNAVFPYARMVSHDSAGAR